LLALTAWRAWNARDLHRLTLAGAACLFAGAVCMSAPREALYAVPGAAGRYIFVPWIAVSWLVIHAISTRRSLRLGLAAGLLVVAAAWHYRQPPRPEVRWADSAACLELRHTCEVQVTPYPQPLHLPGR